MLINIKANQTKKNLILKNTKFSNKFINYRRNKNIKEAFKR